LKIKGNGSISNSFFKPLSDLRTHEYPGFSTDLQPQVAVFLTQTSCESKVFETIYEGRFKYVEDLQKMGANVTIMNPREILVKGPTALKHVLENEELSARDIRAGFAVVMAALTATGKFTVNNVHLIDRGYERLEEKLKALGANIQRVTQ
jgi:UDP-N-acetylglucosamine 1-carboxyvinyltransferase